MPDRSPPAPSRRAFLGGGLAATALAGTPWPASAQQNSPMKLRELYNKDLSFSAAALERKDSRVMIDGFMAPPLRAESNFFVLTRRPMAVCPFCESEADWPADIVAVYTKRIVKVVSFNLPIRVAGILELGTHRDADLGFVSRVRLTDATYERA